VIKGWGVWLETVEITDVQIKSGSLFKDLQAPYRMKVQEKAELYRMKSQADIDVIQQQKKVE